MTYKLNSVLRLIKSPVILVGDEEEQEYPSGEALLEREFDKYYVVSSITAKNNHVVVSLKENDRVFDMNWIGEDAVSFM